MESFSGNLPFESRDIQTDHDIEKNITQSFNKLEKRRHIRSCSRVSNENSSVGNGILDVHMIICPGLSLPQVPNTHTKWFVQESSPGERKKHMY